MLLGRGGVASLPRVWVSGRVEGRPTRIGQYRCLCWPAMRALANYLPCLAIARQANQVRIVFGRLVGGCVGFGQLDPGPVSACGPL
jgi:hypothetical protein